MGTFLSTATDTRNKFDAQNPYNTAASMATAQANQKQIYDQQQALAGGLQAQAAGQGPSASQTMLAQAQQNNNAAALGAATGNRGINQGMALRMAQQGNAAANQQANAQGIAARQQEQVNAQGMLGNLYGQMGNQNTAQQGLIVGAQQGSNSTNAATSYGNQQQGSKMVDSVGQIIMPATQMMGTAMKAAPMAAAGFNGGMVPGYADGGTVMPSAPPASSGPQSQAAQFLKNGGSESKGLPSWSSFASSFQKGGQVQGKDMVKGNNLINDTVPAMLSPKEIVLPLSVTQVKNAPEAAKRFVAAILAKQGMKK